MRSKTKEQHLSELGLTTNDITPPNTAPFQIPRNLTEFFSVGARINDAMSTFMNQLQNLGLYSEKVVLEESVLQSAVAAHSTPNKLVVPVTEAAMSTQEGRATLSKQFGFDPAKVEQVVAKNIATAQQDSTKTPAPNKPLPTTSIRYKVNHNGVASELVLVHTTIGSGATRQVGKGTGKKLSREWLQKSLEKSSPEVRKQLESYVKLAENPEYELYVQPLGEASASGASTVRASDQETLHTQQQQSNNFEFNSQTNPGPLADIESRPSKNFYSGKYNSITLEKDLILYRGGNGGGGRNAYGQWFTKEAPKSIAEVRINTAVKKYWTDPETGVLTGTSHINAVYGIKFPKGTTIYEGPVRNQGSLYVGGDECMQIFVQEPYNIEGHVVVSEGLLK